jgi:hypothetical protein
VPAGSSRYANAKGAAYAKRARAESRHRLRGAPRPARAPSPSITAPMRAHHGVRGSIDGEPARASRARIELKQCDQREAGQPATKRPTPALHPLQRSTAIRRDQLDPSIVFMTNGP